MVLRAIDLGVNFVDTANTYGDRRFVSSADGYPKQFPTVEETLGSVLKYHEDIAAVRDAALLSLVEEARAVAAAS